MKVFDTAIVGVKYVELDAYVDERGIFAEAFVKDRWKKAFMDFEVSQVNLSKSEKPGTIRGMHWQDDQAPQGKIVFAAEGSVFDAVVDVRWTSCTFGKTVCRELFPQANALFIPKGVAHGFQSLSQGAMLMYLVDAPYAPHSERGIRYDDPDAKIPWPMPAVNVAAKDLKWPTLKEIAHA